MRAEISLSAAAQLCTRLGRALDVREVALVLEDTARILGAVGLVVWWRCCMNTRCGWGGVARTSRDPPQEPHYGDEVEGSSQV